MKVFPNSNDNNSVVSSNKQRLMLIKPFLGKLIVGFIVMIITIVIQLSLPQAIAYFIDHIITQADTTWLTTTALAMVLIVVIYCIATSIRYYLFESVGIGIVTNIRRTLFGAIVRQEIGFFDSNQVGELVSRLSSDVEVLKNTLSMGLAITLRSVFVFIGGIAMLLILSPSLAIIVLFVIPVSLFSGQWLGKKARAKSNLLQQSLAQCVQIAQEHFTNIRLIHAFNQQRKSSSRYHSATAYAQEKSLANAKLFAIFQGLSSLITYSFVLLILWAGGLLVTQQVMSVGELTSFVLYAGMVTGSAIAISGFWGDWMRSYGATERVFEIINRAKKSTPSQRDSHEHNVILHGEIKFSQVSFSYPNRPTQTVLSEFNLAIEAGEKIALVGPSGAGKTTIANLLLGFYEPTAGNIIFDSIHASKLSLSTIRDSIATVAQEPTLFSGTIAENIGFAVNDLSANKEVIERAAQLANAHAFITKFPLGYQTVVGENGIQLSGGQKQRIAIARALLKEPKILILDEATSALDAKNEDQIQQALSRLMQRCTTIIISHRYSTIVNADRVIVLNKGQIVQSGNHSNLYSDKDGLYYNLMENQR